MVENSGPRRQGPQGLLENQRGLRQGKGDIRLEEPENEASRDESQEDTAPHEKVRIGRKREEEESVQGDHEEATGAQDIPQQAATGLPPNDPSNRFLYRYHLHPIPGAVRLSFGHQRYRK